MKKTNKNAINGVKLHKLLLIISILYVGYILINQQITLNKYSTEVAYYEQMKIGEQERNIELIDKKENINSDDFIEKIAREQLGLVMPNETIYVDSTRY